MNQYIRVSIYTAAFCSLVLFIYALTLGPTETSVSFLSVGQGDAILIDAGNGNQILIDSGRGSRILEELGSVMKYGDKTIEVLIATHYDADHIGGMDDVLDHFHVETALVSNAPLSNNASRRFHENLKQNGVKVYTVMEGSVIRLGNGVVLRILYPFKNTVAQKGNEGSVIAKVYTPKGMFMLTGDASSKIEKQLVGRFGQTLRSDVLKLGHHGSKTSTADIFLKTVDPDIAVVSAGEHNQYGHPHKSVLDRLRSLEIPFVDTFREKVKF